MEATHSHPLPPSRERKEKDVRMEEFEKLGCAQCPHPASIHDTGGCIVCDCGAWICRIPARGNRLIIYPYPVEFMGPDRRPTLSLS